MWGFVSLIYIFRKKDIFKLVFHGYKFEYYIITILLYTCIRHYYIIHHLHVLDNVCKCITSRGIRYQKLCPIPFTYVMKNE